MEKSGAKSSVRAFFNPDAFVGRVVANWFSICIVVAIFYLPEKVYEVVSNLSNTSFAVLVGIFIGSFLQSKIRLFDVIQKASLPPKIQTPSQYPSALLHPQHSAAVCNEVIEAIWPKLAKLLKKKIPQKAIPIKKSKYSVLCQDIDLNKITCRVVDLQSLRPEHLNKSTVLIKCVCIIQGKPNASIQLISDSALSMNITANVNSIDVRANVYVKASLEYNTLQIYFDDDISADINMDADLTKLKLPMAGESFLAEALINYLINYDEQNPIVIDTSKYHVEQDPANEESGDEASREASKAFKRGAPLGVLKITLVSATNLKKGDVFGSSDPYVKLKHQGKKYKTEYIKQTLNPTWNETFDCVICSEQETLKFEVKDKDIGSTDDLLGTLVLQTGRFMETSEPQSKSFPLIKQGELQLVTNWNPLDDGEQEGLGAKSVHAAEGDELDQSDESPEKKHTPKMGEEDVAGETAETGESVTAPKANNSYLCPTLVHEVWEKHRGDAPGPQSDMIDRAILKSDANSNGLLERNEFSRLAIAFVVKSQNAVREDEVFDLLNADNNEAIGRDEVKTAFKAMWLMQKNSVKLEDMLRKRDHPLM